jgi:hypothetical protein
MGPPGDFHCGLLFRRVNRDRGALGGYRPRRSRVNRLR